MYRPDVLRIPTFSDVVFLWCNIVVLLLPCHFTKCINIYVYVCAGENVL
jgi:hypothetical protein